MVIPCRVLIPYTLFVPRVEYTLSFENYLEMTQGRSNIARIRPQLIVVATGFSLLVAGYGWLRVMPESWSALGGILLGFGLLATILAGLLGIFTKRRDVRSDSATLRCEHVQYHSDRRAIEFDENGWRLFWYEGEDTRPWSCLRAIYDQKTLLTLATETTYYWLPKADFEREKQLENLRSLAQVALAQHQKLFSVRLQPSLQVYVVAWIVHNWRRQYKAMFLGCAGLTLFCYWIFFANASGDSSLSLWPLIFAPLVVLAFEALWRIRTFYSARWAEAGPEIEVMSDCIAYRGPTAQHVALYRRLIGFDEFPWGFHLYFDAKSLHFIPKAHFSLEQLAQFRKLISGPP